MGGGAAQKDSVALMDRLHACSALWLSWGQSGRRLTLTVVSGHNRQPDDAARLWIAGTAANSVLTCSCGILAPERLKSGCPRVSRRRGPTFPSARLTCCFFSHQTRSYV